MKNILCLLIIMLATTAYGDNMDYMKLLNICNNLFDRGEKSVLIEIAYKSEVSVSIANKLKIMWCNAVVEESDQGQAVNIHLQIEPESSTASALTITLPAGFPSTPTLWNNIVFVCELKNEDSFYKEPQKMILRLYLFPATPFLFASRYFMEGKGPDVVIVNGGIKDIKTLLNELDDKDYYNHQSNLKHTPVKYLGQENPRWRDFFDDLANRPNIWIYRKKWRSSISVPKGNYPGSVLLGYLLFNYWFVIIPEDDLVQKIIYNCFNVADNYEALRVFVDLAARKGDRPVLDKIKEAIEGNEEIFKLEDPPRELIESHMQLYQSLLNIKTYLLQKNRECEDYYNKRPGTFDIEICTAAGNGDTLFLQYMAYNKVDLNAKDQIGRSALYYAIAKGRYETAIFLLQNNINPFHKGTNDTLTDFALIQSINENNKKLKMLKALTLNESQPYMQAFQKFFDANKFAIPPCHFRNNIGRYYPNLATLIEYQNLTDNEIQKKRDAIMENVTRDLIRLLAVFCKEKTEIEKLLYLVATVDENDAHTLINQAAKNHKPYKPKPNEGINIYKRDCNDLINLKTVFQAYLSVVYIVRKGKLPELLSNPHSY